MEALVGILGVLVGIGAKYFLDLSRHNKDRNDKYFFALLSERFRIYQTAYSMSLKLRGFLHSEGENRDMVYSEVNNWLNENSLYLDPDIRKKYHEMLFEFSVYSRSKEETFESIRSFGSKSREAIAAKEKLQEKFELIMFEIQEKIQIEIDSEYYSKIRKITSGK